jgi:hypothetical protein
MGDPVTAAAVAKVAAPTIAELAGQGAIVGGMSGAGGAAGGGSILSALNSGMSAGSMFGQGGLMSQAGQGLGVFNQAKQAFGLGGEQPMQMAPAGQISRGQIQPMDYMSLLNPQNQQSVMRPQPISLL